MRDATLYQRVSNLNLDMPVRVFASLVFMLMLVCIVLLFGVPNPNVIMIAGLVVCCTLLGESGGIAAALATMVFTLFFFSEGGNMVTFAPENLQKVIVSAIGVVCVTAFVCRLWAEERRAYRDLQAVQETLKHDNELLKTVSLTDALTGVRNRLALRADYDNYATSDDELWVMMLDVDDFKSINDTLGHETGDHVLALVGETLAEQFGREHVYRYGGDEFLMVRAGLSEDEVRERVEALAHQVSETSGQPSLAVSGGYVHGRIKTPRDLRQMMRVADTQLYEAKRAGKNRVFGGAF